MFVVGFLYLSDGESLLGWAHEALEVELLPYSRLSYELLSILRLFTIGVDVLVDGVHHAVTQGLAHIDQELVCLFVEQLLDHHPSLVVDGLIGMVLVRSMMF